MTVETRNTSASIDELIATHHLRYAREYGSGLSDHGPMAFLAMRGLGLPEEAIREFAAFYVTKLERAEAPSTNVNAGNYPEFVGKQKHYSALLEFFSGEMQRQGGLRPSTPTCLDSCRPGRLRRGRRLSGRWRAGVFGERGTRPRRAGVRTGSFPDPDSRRARHQARVFLCSPGTRLR